MNYSVLFLSMTLLASVGITGCERNRGPVESTIDTTKDALDLREHEKLKDAGEDMRDAAKNAAQGVRDETR